MVNSKPFEFYEDLSQPKSLRAVKSVHGRIVTGSFDVPGATLATAKLDVIEPMKRDMARKMGEEAYNGGLIRFDHEEIRDEHDRLRVRRYRARMVVLQPQERVAGTDDPQLMAEELLRKYRDVFRYDYDKYVRLSHEIVNLILHERNEK